MGDAFSVPFILSWLGMYARREEEYMLPSAAVDPLELLVALVNLDLSISDYFNNIKKLFYFFCFKYPLSMDGVGVSRHKESHNRRVERRLLKVHFSRAGGGVDAHPLHPSPRSAPDASLAFRTLSLLYLTSSSGISVMSLAE